MHQSTVSRGLQLLQRDFELEPGSGSAICRHGHNGSLEHLRLAYRSHRLMKGVLRLGTDGLHQPLLMGCPQLQAVPPRFRSLCDWTELVRTGLLDGAIVSSLALEKPRPPAAPPRLGRLQLVPLGRLELRLFSGSAAQAVLLPPWHAAPQLHQGLRRNGHRLEVAPSTCLETEAWIHRLRERQLALPLPPALAGDGWLRQQGLKPLPQQPQLEEQLWLMLPQGPLARSPLARRWIRRLERRMAAAGGR
jgi:hypothetical protein